MSFTCLSVFDRAGWLCSCSLRKTLVASTIWTAKWEKQAFFVKLKITLNPDLWITVISPSRLHADCLLKTTNIYNQLPLLWQSFFKKFFIHVHHFSLKGYFQISEQMYSHFNLVFFSSSHLWVNKLHVSLSWKTFTVWHLVFHVECALNSAVSNVKRDRDKFSPWLLFSST